MDEKAALLPNQQGNDCRYSELHVYICGCMVFVCIYLSNIRHLFCYNMYTQDRLGLLLLIPALSMAVSTHPLRHLHTSHLRHPQARTPLLKQHPGIPQQHHTPHLLPATPTRLLATQAPLQQDTNHHHPHSMVVVLDTSSTNLHPPIRCPCLRFPCLRFPCLSPARLL